MKLPTLVQVMALGLACHLLIAPVNAQQLRLTDIISAAQQADPWQHQSQALQQARLAQSQLAGQLPDPKWSAKLQNVPLDNFSFNQHAMTQLNLGFSQTLPRGDSLTLQQRQLALSAQQFPYQRQNRQAWIKRQIALLWLQVYLAKQQQYLIQQNKEAFVQLLAISQAHYANTLGSVRQHDVIAAQTELSQLDDKLSLSKQQQQTAIAQLLQWVDHSVSSERLSFERLDTEHQLSATTLLTTPQLDQAKLLTQLQNHPALLAIKQQQLASKTAVSLAKQAHKPQWQFSANYGYRDAPSGIARSDFFSIGVSVDMPLWDSTAAEAGVTAATAKSEAIKLEQSLWLKQQMTQISALHAKLQLLEQRLSFYQQQLIQQSQQHAEATLTAYTNDDGSLPDVLRAQIMQLDTQMNQLQLQVDRLQVIHQLNYLLTSTKQTGATIR